MEAVTNFHLYKAGVLFGAGGRTCQKTVHR